MSMRTMLHHSLHIGLFLLILCINCAHFYRIIHKRNADESRIQESEYKFAIELLRYVTRNGHTSFVISPFSIAITLSILSYGAVGNTQAQIDKLIANGIEHQRTQNYFKTHNDQLQNSSSNSTISNTAFHSLNLIVIRQKNNLTSINEQFRLNTVHEYYRSQIMLNDFSNATDLISDIDEWIRAESDSYIDTIANQANTRPQSKILVFNAVWMWAEWIKKFKNEETFLKDFYVNQDEIKRVNMMPIWAYGTYRYGENADLQVVGIPFSDEETYMYIFLTRDRYAVLNDFIKDMDYQRIIALINRCKIVDVEVEIPTFRIETEFSMRDALVYMGIHDAFTTNADFSSISNDRDENLFLSGIYQKTIFEINENGTMPSDVRRPNLRPLKRMLWQGGHIKFIADHPFWFAIVKQNLFLFIGSFTG